MREREREREVSERESEESEREGVRERARREESEGEIQGNERHPKGTLESPAPPLFAWISPNAYNAPDSENGEEDWPPWGR